MAASGDRLAGRYELLEPIGSGGMAIVWRARDLRLGRTVAVKILRPQFAGDAEFVERFATEAHHAASLAHEHIAAVYDTGVDGETRFIVMELVDGPSVADLIQSGGTLPIALAISIATAAARALAAAHRRGLVHRDVKPANILIGRDGRVRLADFGIARALSASRVTTVGVLVGSGPYMSPEQRRGDEVMAASDLFSLGVVLYEMLHGELPPDAGTPAFARVPAGDVADDLPAGVNAIVERAIAADPARRFPSARSFADALDAAARQLRKVDRGTGEPALLPIAAATTGVVDDALPLDAMVDMPMDLPSDQSALIGVASPARLMAARAVERGAIVARTVVTPAPAVGRREPRPSPPPRDEGRRRRRSLVPVFGIGALVAAAFVGVGLVTAGAGWLGAVLGETGSPAAGAQASQPSRPATSAVAVAPSPSVTPSVPASPAPADALDPSPAPTPSPTRRPVVVPAPTPPPPVQASPAGAVSAFYQAVEAHDWDTATRRWSARMQRQYPPDEWLVGRFSKTTRIDLTRLRQTSFDPASGRATVAVTLVEYRDVEPSPRTFVGSWELVRSGGRWLLDEPHF